MTDIALERTLLRDQGLRMRLREEYGALQDYTSDRDCDVPAVAFFLHIAVVDDPGDLLGTEDQVARRIEAIGQARFGSGWSYNAGCFNTGRLYEGQPLTRRGTHTVNTFRKVTCPVHGGSLEAPVTSSGFNNNVNARALVLPQQVDDPVTDEQIDSAARWAAAQILSSLALPTARWHGHRCVTNKGCPGDRAFDRISELQALTDRYVKHGLEDDMPYTDWPEKAQKALISDILNADVGDGRTVKTALRMASKAPEMARDLERLIIERVMAAVPPSVSEEFADYIEGAVKAGLADGVEAGVLAALRKGTG